MSNSGSPPAKPGVYPREITRGGFWDFAIDFKNVSGTVSLTMEMKTERIGRFMITAHTDIRGRVTKTVFLNHVPVAHFHAEDAAERKLAAIELVERDLCTNKVAGKICGFHRNTVFKLLRTKRLLGLEAVFKDDRGLKEPCKHVNEVRGHIKQIIRRYPDWTDQAVAEQAAKDLDMDISRSAVARIRNEGKGAQRAALPTKSELMEMSRMAEAIDEECFHGRQLRMNFEQDPELKRKSAECSREPSPKVRRETVNTGRECPQIIGIKCPQNNAFGVIRELNDSERSLRLTRRFRWQRRARSARHRSTRE